MRSNNVNLTIPTTLGKDTGFCRVLIITHSTSDNGEVAAPAIRDQVEALRKFGVQIETLTITTSRKISYLRAAVKVFLLNFQSRHYDLIHAYYSLLGMVARFQLRYPVVLTYQGSDLVSKTPFSDKGGRDTLVGKILSLFVSETIVMSPEMKQAVPFRKEHVHIIPFGINTEIFSPIPQELARRELNLPQEEKLVLFPWNPERQEKRFAMAQEAVQTLKDEYPVRLIAVFGKPRETLALYMNACDALVVTSTHEGSPVAVREAMACNLPIVSVRVGDVPQLIGDIEGCYLCEANAQSIASALQLVIKRGQRVKSREKIIGFNTHWSAREVQKVYQLLVNRESYVG